MTHLTLFQAWVLNGYMIYYVLCIDTSVSFKVTAKAGLSVELQAVFPGVHVFFLAQPVNECLWVFHS